MKRIAVQAAMVRRAASGLLLGAALAASPALAADRALIDYIGYSADAKYFAFEEFGMQDGSGFPYATIYIVDLDSDQWVGQSPYRIVLENDGASVAAAREAAHAEAGDAIDEFGIDVPADLLALKGDGDAETGDGIAINFGRPGYGMDAMPASQTLNLGVFPRPASEDCSIIDDQTFGFSLSLDGEEIHADGAKLPKSRGCPMGYRIYAVVRPADWAGVEGGTVAIVSSYPFGFEGPNRRFIAVPLEQ